MTFRLTVISQKAVQRTSTVIPVVEAGKDESDPSSYRPIALTSCICKIMERMINDRLVWYLEKHKLLTSVQCGFHKNRSTTDYLVCLETFVHNHKAFIQRQHVVTIFDLEKAYDTTWKYGIMRDLHCAGLQGRLPTFIMAALRSRCRHYIFVLFLLSSFFPRLISAIADWMSAILPHMVRP